MCPRCQGKRLFSVNAGNYGGGFTLTAYNSAGSALGTVTVSEDLSLSDGQIFEISDFDARLGSGQDIPTLPALGSHKSFRLSGGANKLLATYDISGMTKDNPESVCVDNANHCVWIADDDKTSVLHRIDLK